jgi:hypothetical protein
MPDSTASPNNSLLAVSADQSLSLKSPGCSFHLFPKLAPEIREMIWLEATSLPRVVVIIHDRIQGEKDGNLVSRAKNFKEPYPGLLGACRESRNLVPNGHYNAFYTPQLRKPRYYYIGNGDWSAVRNITHSLIPDLDLVGDGTRRFPIEEMVRLILNHLSRHVQATEPTYAVKLQRETRALMPAFFNRYFDIILLRRGYSRDSFIFSGVWGLASGSNTQKVRNLAIELDHLTYRRATQEDPVFKCWSNIKDYSAVSDLKVLYLVCLNDKEVVRLTWDTLEDDSARKLKKKEWIFALETSNELFKAEMGENWTGVLWKVELGNVGDKNLWQVAKEWKPNARRWEDDKRRICRGNVKVPAKWWDADRVQNMDARRIAKATVLYRERGGTKWYEGTYAMRD